MDRFPLADPAAVAAMAAGNPAGLEAVYRRYADRLHAYARSIVDDSETAADVVQETFVIAHERVRQLRDPARLGSWLYAIARNECLARLRARKRTVMLGDAHEPVLDTDPGRELHAAQIRELVQAASAGMNEGDREVLELSVRHGLGAAEIAQVLGVSDKHAHARISRARSQFEGSLGALLLARDGRGRCAELDAILHGWDGRLTPLLRKRIERHVRECDVCGERRRERLSPATLLAGYAGLPFIAVGGELWQGIARRLSPARAASGSTPVSRTAVAAVAAAGVLLIVGGVATVRVLTLPREATGDASASVTTTVVTTSPTAEPPPVTTPPVTTPPAPPQPFTLTASAHWVCSLPRQLLVTAHAQGAEFGTARVFWTAAGNPSLPMNIDGSLAQRQFEPGGSASTVQWWVSAAATDGRTYTTPKVVSVVSC